MTTVRCYETVEILVLSTCFKVLCVGLCTSSECTGPTRYCTSPPNKAVVCNSPCHKKCVPTITPGTVGRMVSATRGTGTCDMLAVSLFK